MRPRNGGRWSYTIIQRGVIVLDMGGRVVGRESEMEFGESYCRKGRKGEAHIIYAVAGEKQENQGEGRSTTSA